MKYAIVDKNTGEFHDDCGVCLIGTAPNGEDLGIFPIDENHRIEEITDEEFAAIQKLGTVEQ